jgi:hypothetical protein
VLTSNPKFESGREKSYAHDGDDFTFMDMISLTYPDEKGVSRSGVLTIELRFTPSSMRIEYLDVQYSDKQLERQVESSPQVLKNIDAYLRNKLLKLQYNI